jgi:hypothetical protein
MGMPTLFISGGSTGTKVTEIQRNLHSVPERGRISEAKLAADIHDQELRVEATSHGLASGAFSCRYGVRLVGEATEILVFAAKQPLRIHWENAIADLRSQTSGPHRRAPELDRHSLRAPRHRLSAGLHIGGGQPEFLHEV